MAALPLPSESPDPGMSIDLEAIHGRVTAFIDSGRYPGGPAQVQRDLGWAERHGHFGDVSRWLAEAGGDGPSPTLDIAAYYAPPQPGEPPAYERRWPAPTMMPPLPISFARLDHKTQFFVLFGEWSAREAEAMFALTDGRLDAARQMFDECRERARQIDVAELRARSHEGLMRIAQRSGDRAEERRQLERAIAARLGQD